MRAQRASKPPTHAQAWSDQPLEGPQALAIVGLVSTDATAASEGSDVARAGGIAMERYGITEARALAMITRLARHHGVTLGVVAVAIIAASRRRADEG